MRTKVLSAVFSVSIILASAVPGVSAGPSWTLLSPSGLTYGLFRGGSSTVYDPVSNELIVYSGFSQDQSQGFTHLNDVWILSNANGLGGSSAWTNLIPNGAPGSPVGTHNHSAVYDSVNNRMIIFGGCQGGCEPVTNNVWVLINANGQGGTPTWQQLAPTGGPPAARASHQAIYDSTTNTMTIWGGQDGGGVCGGYDDVWVLSNANGLGGTPTWTQLFPSGKQPVAEYFSNAAYDPTNNIMMVFGGDDEINNCGTPTNGVWTLSHANGTGGTPFWTQLQPATSPPARSNAAAVYDPSQNELVVFGGTAPSGFLGDTWVLSHANGIGGTPQWSRVFPGPSFPTPNAGSRWNGQAIDTTNNRMIMTDLGNSNSDGPIWSTWLLGD